MNFYGKKYLAFIELLASQIQQKLKTASANVWNSWNSDIQAIYANKLKFRLHRLDRNTELYYFFFFSRLYDIFTLPAMPLCFLHPNGLYETVGHVLHIKNQQKSFK